MRILSIAALFTVGVLAVPSFAEDKKDKAPTGSYTRKAGDLDLKLVWKKDSMMEFHVTIGDVGAVMDHAHAVLGPKQDDALHLLPKLRPGRAPKI